MNFEEFSRQRYSRCPYDFTHNPFGFKYIHGSDISAHLPLLEFVASYCDHVTEFGVRGCFSTVALLKGCRKKVISYDIKSYPDIEMLKTLEKPCDWEFRIQDTSDPNFQIEETDFLFIDSLHTYEQVKAELKQGKHVRKYIGFHDTYSQGMNSLDDPSKQGIIPAIQEFMQQNPEWHSAYHVIFNHGLTILEKR